MTDSTPIATERGPAASPASPRRYVRHNALRVGTIGGMAAELMILGIAGSLRQASFNRSLLRAAQTVVPEGASIEIYEDLGSIPPYNGDVEAEGDPVPVRALKERIRASDALLIATPEYNYNIPGVLKNAIDWASRPPGPASVLYHKPVAIMGASPGSFGTARSQLALRQTFLFTTSYVLLEPQVYVFQAGEHFDANGELQDEGTRTFICQLIERLVQWTHELQDSGQAPRGTR